jgi:anti-sigma regulatory factor (Ser/Thr protein kinase)
VGDDIELAVGEALANAVEHAYPTGEPGEVSMVAREDGTSRVVVDVIDQGAFDGRTAKPGRGFGLRIARSVARSVTIERRGGTRIRMIFDTGERATG